jgi:hypothetical protein
MALWWPLIEKTSAARTAEPNCQDGKPQTALQPATRNKKSCAAWGYMLGTPLPTAIICQESTKEVETVGYEVHLNISEDSQRGHLFLASAGANLRSKAQGLTELRNY